MKLRDVQVLQIAENTKVLRSRTWDRLKFEIEYALQKGTTANSFLIQADKVALFDPPGESFTEIFLTALQRRIDPQKIDYLIISHINPNRLFTLKALLEIAPQVRIICSNPGAIALKSLAEGIHLNLKIIKSEETLDLGKGHELQFLPITLPRWPDELCTFDVKTKILYTDKLFGAHVCGDQVLDEGWKIYNEDRRYYFDCLMANQAKALESALDKLRDKPAIYYATGHGPLVRYSMKELTLSYGEWIKEQQTQE